MASKNNGSFNFDIPLGIIIAAWFVAPPIGIILTVLRVISEAYKANKPSSSFSAKKAREEFESNISKVKTGAGTKKKAEKNKAESRDVLLPKIGGIALAAATALFAVGAVITATGVHSFPELLLSIVAAGASLIGSIALFLRSKSVKDQNIRLARIRAIIGRKESCNLLKIAAASDTNIKTVRKDVQKLIDKSEFGKDAYIDLGTNNFMRTPDAKPDTAEYDYKKSYGSIFGKKKADGKDDDLGLKSDNDDFRSIIREIRRLNDEIEDEAVSERIDKIEGHTKHIFDYVSSHPDKMPQIRTFMSYYLPTTLKLLESYSRIEKVGVAGENMKKSKENIESTLDALEVAFRMQIDDLFRTESIDISSDISVLETMMSKDGLTEKKDFDLGGAQAEGE